MTIYTNRQEAAELLVQALSEYRGKTPLILAIPRGSVPMGQIIAEALGGELDVALVRKLRAPHQPELAIGSVDETGYVYLADHARTMNLSSSYVEAEKREQLVTLHNRRHQYTSVRPAISPRGRIVIIVDDGIATGSTMIAAIHAARAQNPAKLIVATAVAPRDTLARIAPLADDIVCLQTPDEFYAVGEFFRDFSQVTDEEVVALLNPQSDPDDPEVLIPADGRELPGSLTLPAGATGIILFAHGSGSSRLSPRNRYVAKMLNQASIGTLLFDLLTAEEDVDYETRFNIPMLTQRLITVTQWLAKGLGKGYNLGYFGASTGAASALIAAAELGPKIKCVVSRGGRPDLAMKMLDRVQSPTLLLVGGEDYQVIELNQLAFERLRCEKEISIIPGATHLFEEPGTLEDVARLAAAWCQKHLS